ncbi:hypothetical protein C1H46_042293 [Malus baccata]|uniref:Uncharacterized protein n=1 Tax=Malus baccata TaxID=106549 RepID=A0A540KDZ5_MALBA|nr:hypothetical protein C1H46_042293 [Malus baccata]
MEGIDAGGSGKGFGSNTMAEPAIVALWEGLGLVLRFFWFALGRRRREGQERDGVSLTKVRFRLPTLLA